MQNLTGLHKLSGFDDNIPDKENLEDGVCFILDGEKYQVYTNPDDGWRSYISELFKEDVQCANRFESEDVFVVYEESSDFKGIKMYTMSGKIIVELGTSNWDDWYPCAINHFYPENLAINKKLQCQQ